MSRQTRNINRLNEVLLRFSKRDFGKTSKRFYNNSGKGAPRRPNRDKDNDKKALVIKGIVWGVLTYMIGLSLAAVVTQYRKDKVNCIK